MPVLYLMMCLHAPTQTWRAYSNELHYTKQFCVYELLEAAADPRRCRCLEYVMLLPQSED